MLPGNFGMFDQVMALEWVQENIAGKDFVILNLKFSITYIKDYRLLEVFSAVKHFNVYLHSRPPPPSEHPIVLKIIWWVHRRPGLEHFRGGTHIFGPFCPNPRQR